jgi:hypothetical protein
VNSALDRLFQRAFLMRNDNRFAAVAARLDHAAFVFMASLFAYGIYSRSGLAPTDLRPPA